VDKGVIEVKAVKGMVLASDRFSKSDAPSRARAAFPALESGSGPHSLIFRKGFSGEENAPRRTKVITIPEIARMSALFGLVLAIRGEISGPKRRASLENREGPQAKQTMLWSQHAVLLSRMFLGVTHPTERNHTSRRGQLTRGHNIP
jgi:hypothetical protein